jgi:sugar (pentulose or hexulose) kinase
MILVLNLGLKSVRAIVFDGQGRKVSSASRKVSSYLNGDRVEQDGREWWKSSVAVIRQATSNPSVRDAIRGITVTSSACCLVCTDEQGQPLRNTLMVSDRRAAAESRELLSAPIFRQSHNGSSDICSQPSLMLPKLMRLRNHEKATFGKVRWYLSSNDFLILKLTGEAVTDSLNAEKFGYLQRSRSYPSELMDLAGIDENRLPSVAPSGTGVFKTTEEWGFAAPAIFKINLLYGYIDLMTSPPYTDG